MEVCNCSMFCCTLLYVHSSIAIILMGKRELIALLNLSSWCLVMVDRLFLAVPGGCLQFVIVVFPDHTHLLFLSITFLCGMVVLSNSEVSFKEPIRALKSPHKKIASQSLLKYILDNTCDSKSCESLPHTDFLGGK